MSEQAEQQEPGFEQQLAMLERIVAELDSEDLPLEKAITAYEKGVGLSIQLNKTLEHAQRRIEILTQSANGEKIAVPFDEGNGRGGTAEG